MAACRAPGDGNEIGVAAIVGDVFSDPSDGSLHVDDVIGPGGLRTEPVVDRDAHPAGIDEPRHERIGLPAALAAHPSPAGNLHEDGGPVARWQVQAPPDVEPVAPAGRAVSDALVGDETPPAYPGRGDRHRRDGGDRSPGSVRLPLPRPGSRRPSPLRSASSSTCGECWALRWRAISPAADAAWTTRLSWPSRVRHPPRGRPAVVTAVWTTRVRQRKLGDGPPDRERGGRDTARPGRRANGVGRGGQASEGSPRTRAGAGDHRRVTLPPGRRGRPVVAATRQAACRLPASRLHPGPILCHTRVVILHRSILVLIT